MDEPNPLTPKDIHNLEQASAAVREQVCPIVYSFFTGCIEQGFGRDEALLLTNTYLNFLLTKPQREKSDKN